MIVDTREKENSHIIDYLELSGDDIIYKKLDFGDYTVDYKTVVERKANICEFAGNCGKNHARFKRELERAKTNNAKMFIVIEEPCADLENWSNTKGKSKYKKLKSGELREIKPLSGSAIKKICESWVSKYDLEIIFCNKKQSPKIITELLKERENG